jgi:hypothetical protein
MHAVNDAAFGKDSNPAYRKQASNLLRKPSAFWLLKYFDPIQNIAFDVMHGLVMGVGARVLRFVLGKYGSAITRFPFESRGDDWQRFSFTADEAKTVDFWITNQTLLLTGKRLPSLDGNAPYTGVVVMHA